ncbi:MAG: HAD family hydrolase [Burkholderiales bacterium]|nr:HAD family hydrolase [Burkholderiales bacterium]
MPASRPILALDADGVLVDLHAAYATAWQQAFGVALVEQDPLAYWPMDRWGVGRLEGEMRRQLRAQFERESLWASLPAIDGAVQACHRLHDAGYELVCVTALEARFERARLDNLKALGFPIRRVIATGHVEGERSPKADAIAALRPVAFVDDYIVYLRGVPSEVHTALVLRAPNGSPNVGDELSLARSVHQDLADFADHWLGTAPAPP